MKNILSIDVEEYYHPEYVRRSGYAKTDYRTQRNIGHPLKVLDEFDVTATFFVVGEIAEKFPEVLEKICGNGHELAFHGYYHEPLWRLDPETLGLEIKKFSSLVKDGCLGFRAPSFSLNNETRWALKVLEAADYQYDSSIFPTKMPLYGVRGAPTKPYKPSHENVVMEDRNVKLWEFPLLVYPFSGFRIPIAGGFYLRFFPAGLMKRAIRKANKRGFPAVIFLHSWELDPQTPKLKLGTYESFVTYHKIGETTKKLKYILSKFRFMSFRAYMEEEGLV